MPLRPFVQYFVVCGLDDRSLDKEASPSSALHGHIPPLLGTYTPSVLSHFPPPRSDCPFDKSAIQTLCLPDGTRLSKNLKHTNKTFHTFLVTREDGSHVHGSVLVFPEPISDQNLLNSLDSLQSLYIESRRSEFNSDHPDFFDSRQEQLFALKCICLVTSEPIHNPCRAFLEQVYAVTAGSHTPSLPVESYLYNLLYEVTLPEPGKFLRFSGPLGRISWYRPLRFDLPLCDYSFREFFEMLGVREILRALACVLMEHQILLKSSDYQKLMLGANCLATLLFPFSWPHVFVPILPASQRGFLDAPVPYIMGLRVQPSTNTSKFLCLANGTSLCSIDLDRGVVETVDGLPDLPNTDSLISQLTEKVLEHSVNSPDLRNSSPQSLTSMQTKDSPFFSTILSVATRTGALRNDAMNVSDLSRLMTNEEDSNEDEEDRQEEEEEEEEVRNQWDHTPDKKETKFSTAVREIFCSYFVRHFANYDTFIVVPTQTYDQWLKNREQFQNFDKAAFLSDQPPHHWPFYVAFLESSMFTAFVDEKVTSMWVPESAGQRLVLFDARVEAYRDKTGLGKSPTTPGHAPNASTGLMVTGLLGQQFSDDDREEDGEEEEDEGRETGEDLIAESMPLPRQLPGESKSVLVAMRTKTKRAGVFPELDSALLQRVNTTTTTANTKTTSISSLTTTNSRSLSRPSSAKGTLRTTLHVSASSTICPGSNILPRRGKSTIRSGSDLMGVAGGGASAGFSFHSHAKFVSQLMRESRFRVKHMMGSSPDSQSSVEENTHIGTLCDLLERIWGHGLKKRDSKSPLWAHLTAYAESAESEETGLSPPPSHPPSSPPLSSSMSSLTLLSSTSSSSSSPGETSSRSGRGISTQFRRRKFGSPQLRSQIESILQPPPSSLLSDFLIVRNMREIKTDVGHARAFVRLALEKRCLSRHLSALLSLEDLTRQRYKDYAFLRTEEEKEQFLFHLLTLSAKDFTCFTNSFMNSIMVYKVLLVGEGKRFGVSTSSPYITLGGEFGESAVAELPRGENLVQITHNNLGPLTCLRIGHDNSGLAPSLQLEMVLVHNTTTGQIYRFNCGGWLSRSEEDGSLEKFLVGEKVPQTFRNSVNMAALNVDSVLPSPSRQRRSLSTAASAASRRDCETNEVTVQLKESLRSLVDRLRSAIQQSRASHNKVQDMLHLIHGEDGYVHTMEKVLLAGFKSSRKFSKRLYLWDMIERVCDHMEAVELPTPVVHTSPHPASIDRQLLSNTVSRINTNYPQIGKTEKMVLFLCIGLRDHHIATWLSLISHCSPVLSLLYEPSSFLRDSDLHQYLIYNLSSLSPPSPSPTLSLSLSPTPPQMTVRLEPLLTQGM